MTAIKESVIEKYNSILDQTTDPVFQFAMLRHEEFRMNFNSSCCIDSTESVPIIKKTSAAEEVNINVSFSDLHSEIQKQNLFVGEIVHKAVTNYTDENEAVQYVSNLWSNSEYSNTNDENKNWAAYIKAMKTILNGKINKGNENGNNEGTTGTV